VCHLAKFHADRSHCCGDMAFLLFSRWRSSAILDLFYACLDNPRSVIDGLYRRAKFGWNRNRTFEDMRFSIFFALGLKMPIHAPFGGVFRIKMRETESFCSFIPLGMQ